ncbi:MAG: endolytic transglycosylase MltG [Patescibacteria group bacterium]|nr:endolytic transglycosylase MltG [Patescibacteria group bacterium]MDD5164108.1 endolytic transglycosylase MltG [Patescibacteria group bacterium]MDD5534234.1 endolytic transglycosylase MltG [Patescibacteria group bacterium]
MEKKGIIIGYLVFVVVAIGLYFCFNHSKPAVTESQIQTFVVEKGEGLNDIAAKLKDKGIISNVKLFELYAFLTNTRNKFLAGEYSLNKGMTLNDLIKSLTSRAIAQEKTVTIIEGLTNKEIGSVLEKAGLVSQTDFLTALEKMSQDQTLYSTYDFLASQPESNNLEGYLFPDTYKFFKDTTSDAIIRKMLDNFGKKMDDQLRADIKKSNKTIFEVITMSSIVEKEAALDQDRRLVADIFWKRLKESWALESCATINYILGAPKARLSFEDTRTPSPYNTYLHRGLPPGPINNPGLSSIRATIYPLDSDYCCFLSTPEGKIIFSQTIEEHNKNKAEYLK